MCNRKTCVGVLVGDHSINCCNERFGPVNTTENNCVLDCAANHKGRPLIYPVGIQFSSRNLDFSVYCWILNSSLEGQQVQTARTNRQGKSNVPPQDWLTSLQSRNFQCTVHLSALTELLCDMNQSIWSPSRLTTLLNPAMIKPTACRSFTAIVVPKFLVESRINRLAVIDQRKFPGNENSFTVTLLYNNEGIISKSAPHRTYVEKIG